MLRYLLFLFYLLSIPWTISAYRYLSRIDELPYWSETQYDEAYKEFVSSCPSAKSSRNKQIFMRRLQFIYSMNVLRNLPEYQNVKKLEPTKYLDYTESELDLIIHDIHLRFNGGFSLWIETMDMEKFYLWSNNEKGSHMFAQYVERYSIKLDEYEYYFQFRMFLHNLKYYYLINLQPLEFNDINMFPTYINTYMYLPFIHLLGPDLYNYALQISLTISNYRTNVGLLYDYAQMVNEKVKIFKEKKKRLYEKRDIRNTDPYPYDTPFPGFDSVNIDDIMEFLYAVRYFEFYYCFLENELAIATNYGGGLRGPLFVLDRLRSRSVDQNLTIHGISAQPEDMLWSPITGYLHFESEVIPKRKSSNYLAFGAEDMLETNTISRGRLNDISFLNLTNYMDWSEDYFEESFHKFMDHIHKPIPDDPRLIVDFKFKFRNALDIIYLFNNDPTELYAYTAVNDQIFEYNSFDEVWPNYPYPNKILSTCRIGETLENWK